MAVRHVESPCRLDDAFVAGIVLAVVGKAVFMNKPFGSLIARNGIASELPCATGSANG